MEGVTINNIDLGNARVLQLVYIIKLFDHKQGYPQATKDETSETIVRNLYCLFP